MAWQDRYVNRFYRGRPGWVDGTTEFHELCRGAIRPGTTRILEVGAGPSNPTSRFLASLGEVHAVDMSPEVLANDAMKSAVVLTSERYPFPDASFEACVSNFVVEHVADPAGHLREIARILAPGGAYVFRTPNLFHYVGLVSRMTPHSFHRLVANRLRNRAGEQEPWPTVYAMNSRGSVEAAARAAGLQVEYFRLVEKEPSYGMYSRAMFLAFMAYERLVNATEATAQLRSTIFCVLRKPSPN